MRCICIALVLSVAACGDIPIDGLPSDDVGTQTPDTGTTSDTIDDSLAQPDAGGADTQAPSHDVGDAFAGNDASSDLKPASDTAVDLPAPDNDSGVQTVNLSGIVRAFEESGAPLQAATVELVGTAVSVQTDVNGGFSIDVPANAAVFLRATANPSESLPFLKAILGVATTSSDRANLSFDLVSAPTFDGVIVNSIQAARDSTKGAVWVNFTGQIGGESANLLTPQFGTSFVHVTGNQWQIGQTLQANTAPVIGFLNVDLGGATIQIESNPGQLCVPLPNLEPYPVEASTITRIDVQCL